MAKIAEGAAKLSLLNRVDILFLTGLVKHHSLPHSQSPVIACHLGTHSLVSGHLIGRPLLNTKKRALRAIFYAAAWVFSSFAYASPPQLELDTALPSLQELTRASPITTFEPSLSRSPDQSERIWVKDVSDAVVDKTGGIISTAMGFLGVPYRFGGNGPSEGGFDCSGFVRAVYESATGRLLPRRAADQAASTKNISRTELQPGDLVFFTTVRRAFNHVGIYLGDNKFVHAPRTGGVVRVESLNNSYWTEHFTGARRVDMASRDNGRHLAE